jgi:hypothetical protein
MRFFTEFTLSQWQRFFTSFRMTGEGFRMTNMASPSLRHSLLMGGGEGPAPHRVQDLSLNLTWFRVGVNCPFYLGVIPILFTKHDKTNSKIINNVPIVLILQEFNQSRPRQRQLTFPWVEKRWNTLGTQQSSSFPEVPKCNRDLSGWILSI